MCGPQAREFYDNAGLLEVPPVELRAQLSRQLDAGFRGKTKRIFGQENATLERATSADARNSEIARLTLRMEEMLVSSSLLPL